METDNRGVSLETELWQSLFHRDAGGSADSGFLTEIFYQLEQIPSLEQEYLLEERAVWACSSQGKRIFRGLFLLGEIRVLDLDQHLIAPRVMARVRKGHERLVSLFNSKDSSIYGVHTHFGADVAQLVDQPGSYVQHQRYLLNFLSVGSGASLPRSVVRRALRLQAIKMSRGLSGIHPKTFSSLVELSSAEDRHLPKVPSWGSLGASGDLISMAHAVAPLFEEGDHQIRGPRDVMALVNTNAMMGSLAVDYFWRLNDLLRSYVDELAFSMRLFHLFVDLAPLTPRGSVVIRPSFTTYFEWLDQLLPQFPAKADVATLRRVQLPYSFRCAPMVIAHLLDQMQQAQRVLLEEVLGIADNPVLIDEVDLQAGGEPVLRAAHGGLFYALGIARASDLMMDILYRAAEMLDRQVLLMMDSSFTRLYPSNLARGNFSCKGYHQLISSLMQRIKALSTPSRELSFSCESHNQDIVPCAMQHLLVLEEMLDVYAEMLHNLRLILSQAQSIRAD